MKKPEIRDLLVTGTLAQLRGSKYVRDGSITIVMVRFAMKSAVEGTKDDKQRSALVKYYDGLTEIGRNRLASDIRRKAFAADAGDHYDYDNAPGSGELVDHDDLSDLEDDPNFQTGYNDAENMDFGTGNYSDHSPHN